MDSHKNQKHTEDLAIVHKDKLSDYQNIIPQIESIVDSSQYSVSNLSNIVAALKEQFNWWWVGFYLVDPKQPDWLYLGPFQGPVACLRIKHGKGVCGSSWARKQTIVVPDVDKFPGHIACSSKSRSEIVVPLLDQKSNVFGVLDVDSEHLECFNEVDKNQLEKLMNSLIKRGIFKEYYLP